jgi:hypothetical protein
VLYKTYDAVAALNCCFATAMRCLPCCFQHISYVILHKVSLWQLILCTLLNDTQARNSSNSGQLYIDIVDTRSDVAVHSSSSSSSSDSADICGANMTYVQLRRLKAPVRKPNYRLLNIASIIVNCIDRIMVANCTVLRLHD